MGFHLVDILIVAGVVLALFGSKSLQSIARGAGKTMGQAKAVKDKVMAEVPLDEITKVTDHLPNVPLNSRQAVQMLLKSDEKPVQKEKAAEKEEVSTRAEAAQHDSRTDGEQQ